jgi:hypothetical protein
MESTKHSYCLELIVKFAVENSLDYEFSSPKTGVLVETGIIMPLFGDFSINIQTHPVITGEYFSHTTLLYHKKQVYTAQWLYFDTRRQETPEILFSHILELRNILENYQEIENGFKLKDGREVVFLKEDVAS